AIAMGVLVAAVERGDRLGEGLVLVGTVFVLLQVLTPIHQALGANLGDRTAAWLYDRLTEACVRPPGMGHLEDPKLTNDLTVARDFDLGMTGPPLFISMYFIASGLVEMMGGLASAAVLAAYAWWAPILLGGASLATHWLLCESSILRDRNTEEARGGQRVRRAQVGAGWRGCAGRRRTAPRGGNGPRGSVAHRQAHRCRHAGARDPLPRPYLRLPRRRARAGGL